MKLRVFLCLLGLLALAAPAAQAAEPTSKYTSTAQAKALSFKEHTDEPGGGFEGVFPGLGGYQLLHLAGDDRSWINLRYRGKTVDLYSATMERGPGMFPYKANDVVEWRGIETGGRFSPYAIIYRLAATDEKTQKTRTRLIVIQLDGERSRIIGQAEGAGEDAKAKAIADRARRR